MTHFSKKYLFFGGDLQENGTAVYCTALSQRLNGELDLLTPESLISVGSFVRLTTDKKPGQKGGSITGNAVYCAAIRFEAALTPEAALVGTYSHGLVGLVWTAPSRIKPGHSQAGPSQQQHEAAAGAVQSFQEARAQSSGITSLGSIKARALSLRHRNSNSQVLAAGNIAASINVGQKRDEVAAEVVPKHKRAKKVLVSATPSLVPEKDLKKSDEVPVFESLADALPMRQRSNNQIEKLQAPQLLRALAALRIDPGSKGLGHMRGLIKTALSEMRTPTQDDEALEESVAYVHPSSQSHNESIESHCYQPLPPGSYGQGHSQQPISEPGHSRQSIGQGYHQPSHGSYGQGHSQPLRSGELTSPRKHC